VSRTTLVTGVSRRQGIGFAIARRLLRENGARVFAHSFAPYDATEPWGSDPVGITGVLAGLGGESDRLTHLEVDLADPGAPGRLVGAAVERFGGLDSLVVNHARSQLGALDELDAATLDLTWAVNVRASLLLVQAFAEQYQPGPDGGRVVLFTSGQHLGPAPLEIPYAATKGALQQITRTLADALAERGITVNCVNPGPPTPAGPPRTRRLSSPGTCPVAAGTPRPRQPTSSRSCSPPKPPPSPVRSSTPKAAFAATPPDVTSTARRRPVGEPPTGRRLPPPDVPCDARPARRLLNES